MNSARAIFGGFWSARNLFLFFVTLFPVMMLGMFVSPAQAALATFFLFAAAWLWLRSLHLLDGIEAERKHSPRVFAGDSVDLCLRLTNTGKTAPQMLLVEDQFLAAISVAERHLIPELTSGWEVDLRYSRVAERHRGLYLLGPVRLYSADPLGVFIRSRELDLITRLTVYPSAHTLPNYRIPGPHAASGASMDVQARTGLGDEILSVREYVRGDSPSRIHWRTSARRGDWHVTQLNRTLHAELAVFLDLTRLSRYGLGSDSTTEIAIGAATSILTRGQEVRHPFSLSLTRDETIHYPAGSGLAHLHLLLDRLAIVEPLGEADFWADSSARALALPAGSRAAFIQCTNRVSPLAAFELLRQLIADDIEVDVVLVDDAEFIRIYREQEVGHRRTDGTWRLAELLAGTGAKIWPLGKAQPRLLPDIE